MSRFENDEIANNDAGCHGVTVREAEIEAKGESGGRSGCMEQRAMTAVQYMRNAEC